MSNQALEPSREATLEALEHDLSASRGQEARLGAIQSALFRLAEAHSRDALCETLCGEVIPLFQATRAAIIDVAGRVLYFEDLHEVECDLTRDESAAFGWTVISGSVADLDSPFYEVTESYMLAPLTKDEDVGAIWLFMDGMRVVHDDYERELAGISMYAGIVYANVAYRELLQRQSLTDTLTGIPNRRALELRVRSSLRGKEPFTFYIIDLDNFKAINDSLGHAEGDRVLVACAQAIRDAVRSHDMAARWAGDEFAVVVDGDDNTVGERVQGALRGARINASIGRATYPADGTIEDDVFNAADARMFASKRAKPGRTERGDIVGDRRTTP